MKHQQFSHYSYFKMKGDKMTTTSTSAAAEPTLLDFNNNRTAGLDMVMYFVIYFVHLQNKKRAMKNTYVAGVRLF